MTWNANSIKQRCKELYKVILEYNLDVVGISETRIDKNTTIKVKGFTSYKYDRDTPGGGVALLINENIKQTQINVPKLETIEAVAAQIEYNNGKLTIIAIYIPPKNKISHLELRKLFDIDHKIIVCGDFNSKNKNWNCYSNNNNGNIIQNFCARANLMIHTPAEPTHYPSNKRFKPSIIDFFITKNFRQVNKPESLAILSSDHNPVIMEINASIIVQPKQYYDLSNADWSQYKTMINNSLVK